MRIDFIVLRESADNPRGGQALSFARDAGFEIEEVGGWVQVTATKDGQPEAGTRALRVPSVAVRSSMWSFPPPEPPTQPEPLKKPATSTPRSVKR